MTTMKKKEKKESPSSKASKKKTATTKDKVENKSKKTKLDLPPPDDRYLRLQADFENFRKRTLREKQDIYKRANEDIMQELLPVLDHQDLAFSSLSEEAIKDPVVQGFKMVSDQLLSTLNKFGLTQIEANGEEFDPHLHEAVSHMPSSDVDENHVTVQVRRGYMLGKQLLRPAQVVVSSGSAVEEKE